MKKLKLAIISYLVGKDGLFINPKLWVGCKKGMSTDAGSINYGINGTPHHTISQQDMKLGQAKAICVDHVTYIRKV